MMQKSKYSFSIRSLLIFVELHSDFPIRLMRLLLFRTLPLAIGYYCHFVARQQQAQKVKRRFFLQTAYSRLICNPS